jgi:hypothetical protein
MLNSTRSQEFHQEPGQIPFQRYLSPTTTAAHVVNQKKNYNIFVLVFYHDCRTCPIL